MSAKPVKHSPLLWVALVVLLVSATTMQVVLEGTLRERHFAEGRHEDVLIMSLLRAEWAAQDRRRAWELNELG